MGGCHDSRADYRLRVPGSAQRRPEIVCEVLDIYGAGSAYQHVGAPLGLANLVLGDLGYPGEDRSEDVWMNGKPARILEDVVVATLDVGDPPVSRSARAGLVDERDLVGDLITDQRLHGVEQVGQIDSI